MIKTTKTSCLGVSVYPNEFAQILAESRTSLEQKKLGKNEMVKRVSKLIVFIPILFNLCAL